MSELKITFKKVDPDNYHMVKNKKVQRGYCRACGSRLTDPVSIARGYGRNCWKEVPTMVVLEVVEAVEQCVQRTDATEPPCEIASGCYFGQDGKCLRGGVCR